MLSRQQYLLEGIGRHQPVLEIGPSFRPLIKKKDGFNVKIADHDSAEILKQKYQGHGVDLNEIEEVDFIFKGQRFAELVQGEKFEYILASHVIEHVPDLINFLQDCEEILLQAGELRLAIPDKRYCFDHNRECSSLSRILDVYELQMKQQTVGAAAEYFLTVCKKNGQIAWDSKTNGPVENVHTLEQAKDAILKTREGKYLDIHNWVFTPDVFSDIIKKLRMLGYFNLTIEDISETNGHEFFVILKKQSLPA